MGTEAGERDNGQHGAELRAGLRQPAGGGLAVRRRLVSGCPPLSTPPPPDCTAAKPATNWNSTFFDQLMKDFMTAVCGPDAVHGACDRLSVIQQLSTMPSWM